MIPSQVGQLDLACQLQLASVFHMTTTWSESNAILASRKGPTLADLMLARGAQLPAVAPRTAEQVVTTAEVVEEAETVTAEAAQDVAVIEVGPVPADAPCSHPSCAHANPNTPCWCTFCIGAGHGWITAQRGQAAYTRRVGTVGGDPFRLIPGAHDADLPW